MKPVILANWKSNKTITETVTWVEKTKAKLETLNKIQVVVCGSFITLPSLTTLLSGSPVKVGAQNVSHLGLGAYTGEIAGEMLEGLVDYCIVGHSERKKYFGETPEMIIRKTQVLVEKNIVPVLCISDLGQLDDYLKQGPTISDQAEKIIFVYEPPGAISGGGNYHPVTPEEANSVCQQIKEKLDKDIVTIYGGSVNPDNIKEFLSQENVQGALPGQSSLDPDKFVSLVELASEAVI